MSDLETMSDFEKKLQDFLFGEIPEEPVKGSDDQDVPITFSLQRHREAVTQALEQNFSDNLFRHISQKIAAALEAEGELDMAGLREKCSSVARLEDALLLRHLEHAIESGLVGSRTQDGTVLYYAIARKEEE